MIEMFLNLPMDKQVAILMCSIIIIFTLSLYLFSFLKIDDIHIEDIFNDIFSSISDKILMFKYKEEFEKMVSFEVGDYVKIMHKDEILETYGKKLCKNLYFYVPNRYNYNKVKIIKKYKFQKASHILCNCSYKVQMDDHHQFNVYGFELKKYLNIELPKKMFLI